MNIKNLIPKISITSLLLVIVLFVGCNLETNEKVDVVDFESCVEAGNQIMESFPEKCMHDGVTYTKVYDDLESLCKINQGSWVDEFYECEHISENTCNELGGNFYQCESACRNNPNAEMCTKQCVAVCKFNDQNNNEQQNQELNISIVDYQTCIDAGNPMLKSYPAKCVYDSIVYVEEIASLNQSKDALFCEANEGNWLGDFNQCEFVGQKVCDKMNGTFNECGSACRNDPNAEFCTLQCVPYCQLNN